MIRVVDSFLTVNDIAKEEEAFVHTLNYILPNSKSLTQNKRNTLIQFDSEVWSLSIPYYLYYNTNISYLQ